MILLAYDVTCAGAVDSLRIVDFNVRDWAFGVKEDGNGISPIKSYILVRHLHNEPDMQRRGVGLPMG